jgi:hypothetical protein
MLFEVLLGLLERKPKKAGFRNAKSISTPSSTVKNKRDEHSSLRNERISAKKEIMKEQIELEKTRFEREKSGKKNN